MSKKRHKRKRRVSVKPAQLRILLPAGARFLVITTAVIRRDENGKEALVNQNVSLREVVKQTSQEMRCKILTGDQAGHYRTFTWYGITILKRNRALWVYSRQEDGKRELVLIIKLLKDNKSEQEQIEKAKKVLQTN
jgi:hypothetical protein